MTSKLSRCGWPLKTGDMYGGSHYIRSAAADLTPQGHAILNAAIKFGDGKTLPFPPCKRYYNPYAQDGTRMYACRLHNHLRMKRFEKEGRTWRGGEKILDEFWSGDEPKSYCEGTKISAAKTEGPEECRSISMS